MSEPCTAASRWQICRRGAAALCASWGKGQVGIERVLIVSPPARLLERLVFGRFLTGGRPAASFSVDGAGA